MRSSSNGRRRALALGLAASLAGVAIAAPQAAFAQEPRMGGTLVAAVEGEPTSVDPAFDYDFVSGLATSSITEPLLVFCENDTQLCPNLATEWSVSPDGLVYTLKIRQGVKFHDGTDMTVEDVVFSIDRVRDPELGSYVGWMLAAVESVEAPDAETVVITLSQPDALFEYALASTAVHVVNKAFVEASGDRYGSPSVGSIGTGPFKFVEWVSGDHQTLARNDDYWNKANGGPYLDEVIIKILPEPTTRVAGLDTGEIDYLVNNVPSDQYATVQAMDNVNLTFAPSYYGEWITFNTQAAPFDNATLRQAMNYAVDKVGLRTLFYGPETPATKATIVYPTMWTFENEAWEQAWEELPAYDQDLEKAAQLLEESGVADQLNGTTIAYYDSTPSVKGIGESFIDSMAQLGISIEAQKVTYQEAIALQFGPHDDYDIIVGSWGSDFPDPSGNLRPNFGSENIVAGGSNASAYRNERVDELLTAQNEITDKSERAKLLIEAQAIIAEESPLISVTNPSWPLATNKRVQDAEIGALWYWASLFKDVWVTE
jgi:peptide/nickel transport system substrate-binding protein